MMYGRSASSFSQVPAFSFSSSAGRKLLPVVGYVLSDLLLLCKTDGKSTAEVRPPPPHSLLRTHLECCGPSPPALPPPLRRLSRQLKPFLLEPIEEIAISRRAEPAAVFAHYDVGGSLVCAELRVHSTAEAWLLALRGEAEFQQLEETAAEAQASRLQGGGGAEEEDDPLGGADTSERDAMATAAMARLRRDLLRSPRPLGPRDRGAAARHPSLRWLLRCCADARVR